MNRRVSWAVDSSTWEPALCSPLSEPASPGAVSSRVLRPALEDAVSTTVRCACDQRVLSNAPRLQKGKKQRGALPWPPVALRGSPTRRHFPPLVAFAVGHFESARGFEGLPGAVLTPGGFADDADYALYNHPTSLPALLCRSRCPVSVFPARLVALPTSRPARWEPGLIFIRWRISHRQLRRFMSSRAMALRTGDAPLLGATLAERSPGDLGLINRSPMSSSLRRTRSARLRPAHRRNADPRRPRGTRRSRSIVASAAWAAAMFDT